jgi:hypothetical protein
MAALLTPRSEPGDEGGRALAGETMALLLRCGAVFLHVPKTGGNWVERVLRDQKLVRAAIGLRHETAEGARTFPRLEGGSGPRASAWFLRQYAKRAWLEQAEGFDLRRADQFCFVRHPLRWWESYFRYMWTWSQRLGGGPWPAWGFYGARHPANFPHPWTMLNGLETADFNTFMRSVNRTRPGYVSESFGWYTSWDADSRVVFVGRQERLADDLVAVLRQLGVRFDENRLRATSPVNESQGAHIPIRWDPGVLAETERNERVGLVRYGYEAG